MELHNERARNLRTLIDSVKLDCIIGKDSVASVRENRYAFTGGSVFQGDGAVLMVINPRVHE